LASNDIPLASLISAPPRAVPSSVQWQHRFLPLF